MNEEFEKSPSRLAYEREVFTGMSDPEMFFRIWDMAWQASRKQALSEAANKCDEWATQLTAYDSAKCATAETCAEIIREMQKE